MNKTLFLSNLLLSIVWVMATGILTQENFLFGFIISFGILWIITFKKEDRKYFVILPKISKFILNYLFQVIKSNFHSLRESFYPKSKLDPAIIKVPLEAKSDFEVSLLANLISITPGTMIMDISDDKKVIYVHVMHLKNKEEFINEIKVNLEKPLLDIIR